MWDQNFEDILRRQLPFLPPDEPVAEDTSLRDFGLDSLGMVELLSVLENSFGVRFAEEQLTLDTFETAGTLWKALSDAAPAD